MKGPIRCIIFDLDGTLVDSRDDLIAAVNRLLDRFGFAHLPPSIVLPFIGRGMHNLVLQTLEAAGAASVPRDAAFDVFEREYEAHLLDATRPYPAVPATLARLDHLPLAVVSNKPARFTRAVLDGTGIGSFFPLALGGDSLAEMKPSAAPILHVSTVFGIPPGDILTVGDSRYDIEAARAAGTMSCAALYGFQSRDVLLACRPDAAIETFDELLAVVNACG